MLGDDERVATPGTPEFAEREKLFEILRKLTQRPNMDAFTAVMMSHSDGELQMSVISMSMLPEKGPEMALIGMGLAEIIQQHLAAAGIEELKPPETH
jgi:hypothetical protein